MSAELHLALVERARAATTLPALAFLACNATDTLVRYRQAAVLSFDPLGRARLAAHSGLASVEADSPYALWLADLVNHLTPTLAGLVLDGAGLDGGRRVGAGQFCRRRATRRSPTKSGTYDEASPPHLTTSLTRLDERNE